MQLASRLAFAPILGMVACANVWGFQDLTAGPDADVRDATTESQPDDEGQAAIDAAVDAPPAGDDSASFDAQGDARSPDAGEGGVVIREGGVRDAGDAGDDGGAAAECRRICTSGCCDSNNYCQQGTATAACGSAGATCQSCGACPALQTACCTGGACVCKLLSIGCP
jgi:hypothetical protein